MLIVTPLMSLYFRLFGSTELDIPDAIDATGFSQFLSNARGATVQPRPEDYLCAGS